MATVPFVTVSIETVFTTFSLKGFGLFLFAISVLANKIEATTNNTPSTERIIFRVKSVNFSQNYLIKNFKELKKA